MPHKNPQDPEVRRAMAAARKRYRDSRRAVRVDLTQDLYRRLSATKRRLGVDSNIQLLEALLDP